MWQCHIVMTLIKDSRKAKWLNGDRKSDMADNKKSERTSFLRKASLEFELKIEVKFCISILNNSKGTNVVANPSGGNAHSAVTVSRSQRKNTGALFTSTEDPLAEK